MKFFGENLKPRQEIPGDWKCKFDEWRINVSQMPDTFYWIPQDVVNVSAWGRETAEQAIAHYGQDGPVSTAPPRGERSLERLIDFKDTDKLLVKPRFTEFVALPAGPALHVREPLDHRFLDVNCVVECDEYYIFSPLVGDVIVSSLSWARLPESEYCSFWAAVSLIPCLWFRHKVSDRNESFYQEIQIVAST